MKERHERRMTSLQKVQGFLSEKGGICGRSNFLEKRERHSVIEI
jgi:hypothetical protein